MPGSIIANTNIKSAEIEAVITRADGRIERLGVVAYYHRNPLRRIAWNIGHFVKGFLQ